MLSVAHLELLVDVALEQQKNAQANGIREYISTKEWCREFCTVRVQMPRQTGQSTALMKFSERFERPLVTANNVMALNRLRRLKPEGWKGDFFSISRLHDKLSGYQNGTFWNVTAILVDNASFLTNDQMDELYESVAFLPAMSCGQPIILLLVG